MQMMLGLIIFFIFYNPIFSMELPENHVSQEEYDAAYFPLSRDRKQLLDQARAQQALNPQDKQAREIFVKLAIDIDKPCIQAMRELAGNGLRQAFTQDDPEELSKKKHLIDALYWANMGARLYDPLSAFSAASLLQNTDLMPLDSELREQNIQKLLRYAGSKHRMPESSGKKSSHFSMPLAREQLDNFLYDKQYCFEEKVDNCFLDVLPQFEQDGLDRRDLPTGCFFIKKFVYGDEERGIGAMPVRALEWTQTLIESPKFDPVYFRASGAYDALIQLADSQPPSHIKEQVNFLLNHIELCEAQAQDQRWLAFSQSRYNVSSLLQECQQLRDCLSVTSDEERPTMMLDLLHRCKWIITAKESGEPEAFALAADLYKMPEFDQAKKQNHSFALDAAFNLIQISESDIRKINKPKKKQMREQAIQIFKSAYERGDVVAGWALLAHELPHEGTAQLFNSVVHATAQTNGNVARAATIAHEALQYLEKQVKDASIQAQLGLFYLHGITHIFTHGMQEFVPIDEKKAFELLKNAGSKGVDILIHHAEKIYDPTVCLDAAKFLYEKKVEDAAATKADVPASTKSNISIALHHYLDRALMNSPMAIKKEIIEYCFTESRDLYPYAVQAMREYCKSLAQQEKQTKEDSDFANRYFAKFSQRVELPQTDTAAAVLLYDLLQESPTIFNFEASIDRDKLGLTYLDKAAQRGDFQALCKLMPCFKDKICTTSQDYRKAMKFWGSTFIIASESSAPKCAAIRADCIEQINKLDAAKTDTNATAEDALFYYYMMMALSKEYPQRALNAFNRAEKIVYKELRADLDKLLTFSRTGSEACLQRLVNAGHGWASYALALHKYNRFPIMVSLEKNLTGDSDIFESIEQLEECRKLLMAARAARYPHTDFADFSEVCIDRGIGYVYKKAAVDQPARAAYWMGKALDHLDIAAQKGDKEALFVWAHTCLTTYGCTGQAQDVLEKSIDRLIRASELGSMEARDELQDIHEKGYEYLSFCGGTMTTPMRKKISEALGHHQSTVVAEAARLDLPMTTMEQPISRIEQAKSYFNNAQTYQKAYDLFMQEAQLENPEAHVYLGMMHREGLSIEQSSEKAEEFFKKAMLTDMLDATNLMIINQAYEATSQRALTDMWVQEARVKFLLGSYLLYRNGASEDKEKLSEQLINTISLDIIRAINVLENQALQRKEVVLNVLTAHGLLKQMIEVSRNEERLPLLCEIARICGNQLLNMDRSELSDAEKLLNIPFEQLSKLLEQRINKEDLQSELFNGCSDQQINVLITSLKRTIERKDLSRQNELEYLLGLLLINGSIEGEKWASIKEGMLHLNNASMRGYDPATYTIGVLKIFGRKLMSKMPKDENNGIAILEKLGKSGYERAFLSLGGLFLVRGNEASNPKESKNNFKRAYEYYEALLAHNPNNADAAYAIGLLSFEDIGGIPEAEKQEKYTALFERFNIACGRDKIKKCANLYKAYLAITDYIQPKTDAMKLALAPSAILDEFERILVSCEKDDEVNALFTKLFNRKGLDVLFKEWCQNLEKKSEKNVHSSRAYCIYGWMHSLMGRNTLALLLKGKSTQATGQNLREHMKFSKECTQRSFALPNVPLIAYCLSASNTIFDAEVTGSINLTDAKRNLVRASVLMQQQNLTFADVPLFKMVFSDYREFLLRHKERFADTYEKEMKYIEILIDKFVVKKPIA